MRVLIVFMIVAVTYCYASGCEEHKQGACPKPKPCDEDAEEVRDCECDEDCRGDRKCCEDKCGNSYCRAPKRFCWPAGANVNNWGKKFNMMCECKKEKKCKGKWKVCPEGKVCGKKEVCCCKSKIWEKPKRWDMCFDD